MIETLNRIRCDVCGRSDGAHTAENSEKVRINLLAAGWQFHLDESRPFNTRHYCPECAKEEQDV